MQSFPEREQAVLERWAKDKVFEKTLERTKDGPRFVFYEGPPTANGRPGIHHILARAFKDIIPRFKTMQGFYVERKAGWDTHGLPVELLVEKDLGLKSKKDIEAYGIAKFNEACRKSVWKYQEEWERLTQRIGFWLDLEHPYVTYDPKYVESLWWIIQQMWEKELLYTGHKVVPHCPRCGTALSSHEVAQGYETVKDTSVYMKLELVDEPGTFVLAWTTTPWTLPGNLALAVGADIDYVKVKVQDEHYILAKNRVEIFDEQPEVVETMKGSDLVGKAYKPLFSIKTFTESDKAYHIYEANFVTTEDGTGVVHTAVMYGEDDYNLGTEIGLPKHHTVTTDGHFTDEVPDLAGLYVKAKETEDKILEHLQSNNQLLQQEQYEHEYPHCWRCHNPLLYYAKSSWFVRMSSLREELKKNNESINWVPGHIKEGRMGEWLNEVKDWAFSRERYWGTPLPIWESEDGDRICIGSFAELRELAKDPKQVGDDFDPHRPFVDDVVLVKDGKEYRRVQDVCDVWFDSGSMPFAQWYYPHTDDGKKRIDEGVSYPADYISEAIDQTRGWFYTLLAVATVLGKEAPYKNVICLSHILDAKGRKMSKHIGNVVDPWEVIDEFGADVLRFQFFSMNQPGDYKLYDKKGTDEVSKKVFRIFANVVSFYSLHTDKRPEPSASPQHVLDRWVMANLEQVTGKVTASLEAYDITTASRAIADFITELSTWYVRRSRDRFREDGPDKEAARAMLYTVLERVCVLLAPFSPMLADAFYSDIDGPEESVHLVSWPETKSDIDEAVLKSMQQVRAIVETAHALRAEAGVKVRQPLGQVVVKGEQLQPEFTELIQDEVNVREVLYKSSLPSDDDWKQKDNNGLQVALDTTITDELREAGWVRELARQINDERKKMGLDRTDKISVQYHTEDGTVRGLFDRYADELKSAVLAEKLEAVDQLENGKEVKLDEQGVNVLVLKV
ncbi:MAG: isoleucine--tRNA ligase [Candidatus Nomurabacteria bacterium]|nr:MAG: isoleucine--tRNA ligase [Candidatus Nomurabacteria bacterium]